MASTVAPWSARMQNPNTAILLPLSQRLSWPDFALGGALLLCCFFAFFHIDTFWIGQDASSMLFGNVLDFYDNAKAARGPGQNYPALVYLVLSAWMLPLKLLGLLVSPASFSPFIVYWIKVLTSLVYVATGFVFYRVAHVYSPNPAWCKFATAVFLVTPMGFFSQFVFSQVDIFYVFLTLIGFLMFLKNRLWAASIAFGLSMAFKYFPVFVFVPLLLLAEKRLIKLAGATLLFTLPSAIIHLAYRNSPAFTEGVNNFNVLDKLYTFPFAVGSFQAYPIFVVFVVLCSVVFLANIPRENFPRVAAYVFLVAALAPFVVFTPHPQWMLFAAPAMSLALLLHSRPTFFYWADIVGMAVFVMVSMTYYPVQLDVRMFQGNLWGLNIPETYSLGELLRAPGAFLFHSVSIAFRIYLLFFIVGAASLLKPQAVSSPVNYHHVRARFAAAVLIYAIPMIGLIAANALSAH
jgi:hypothetical protein